jgi:uncharacterized protein (TIGR02246 family)
MTAMMAGYVTAYSACDSAGCAAIYAEDAVIYSAFGPPVRGRAAIAAAHEDWFTSGEENKRIEIIDCAAAGNLAFCLIAYSADVPQNDGSVHYDSGTNLCTLVPEAGGWRIRYSSMNDTFLD